MLKKDSRHADLVEIEESPWGHSALWLKTLFRFSIFFAGLLNLGFPFLFQARTRGPRKEQKIAARPSAVFLLSAWLFLFCFPAVT